MPREFFITEIISQTAKSQPSKRHIAMVTALAEQLFVSLSDVISTRQQMTARGYRRQFRHEGKLLHPDAQQVYRYLGGRVIQGVAGEWLLDNGMKSADLHELEVLIYEDLCFECINC